jgi:hypothetical protein
MHYAYSNRPTSPDREILLYKLRTSFNDVFEKQVVTGQYVVHVRGKFDDLFINDDGTVSFVEVKTTGKKYICRGDVESAKFQLQIYLWMYKDASKVRLSASENHYVCFYSQTLDVY